MEYRVTLLLLVDEDLFSGFVVYLCGRFLKFLNVLTFFFFRFFIITLYIYTPADSRPQTNSIIMELSIQATINSITYCAGGSALIYIYICIMSSSSLSSSSSSSSSSGAPRTYVTLPEAILNLYNWPSEKGETWRHMSNFAFFNNKGEMTSLELYEGSKGCVLKGCLLPPPSKDNTPSAIVQRWVSIRISHFSIDFGDDDEDPSRGFWLADFEGAWYKVEEPTSEYEDIANVSKTKCEKFLEFFDVVVHQEVADEEYFSLYDDEAETYSCELTLLELHQNCSPKFDMSFLESNACFYYEQLDNQFSVDCPLMRDLKVCY